MERLTKRIGEYIEIIGCKSLYPTEERKRAPATSAIVRLAAYEDSGLTPDEVSELAKVVRCKDCEYKKKAKYNEKGYLICPASGMEITDNDFCSYGEKKGE